MCILHTWGMTWKRPEKKGLQDDTVREAWFLHNTQDGDD